MSLSDARESLVDLGRGIRPKPGTIALDLSGPIAYLRLDNVQSRNAMTVEMMVQLADAVMALSGWSGAALVVSAAHGGHFCSGGHLGQIRHAIHGPERAQQMHRAMSTVLDTLLALPLISVSVLDGPAIGGGAELATATDFRVLGPQATLHFVHASLGIAPGWGGTARLVQHVGRSAALKILARAQPLSPTNAESLGLAISAAHPMRAAEALLRPMMLAPPEALRAVKAQVQGDRDPAEVFAEVWGAPAHERALDKLRAYQK